MSEQTEFNLREIDVFHYDGDCVNFNDISRDNGFTYWLASEYMQMLGYDSYTPFKKAINKAMTTCMTLDIDIDENFGQVQTQIKGKPEKDYKLSRFACYLVAMNADSKKYQVAQAQAFFAASAETVRRYVDNAEDVERVLIRDEVSAHEKTLSNAASNAGVKNQGFAFFQNAGYRGMYNMNLHKLKQYKGHNKTKRSLPDFMCKDELAANLFRITQTKLKLERDKVSGQQQAEYAAEYVGKKVRKTMLDLGGVAPEDMELVEDIKTVKTSLKQTHKGLKKIDS